MWPSWWAARRGTRSAESTFPGGHGQVTPIEHYPGIPIPEQYLKPLLPLVLLLTVGAELAAAQNTAPDRAPPSGAFGGIEAGVVMFGNAHLNAPSGALRFGSTLDRRGLLRAGVVLSGAGPDEVLIGFTGFLEFRPLSPRRFTPLLGVGGGFLHSIYDAEDRSTNGIGLVSAGVAVRISRGHTVTLRGQYGDSYKQSKFHSIHLGWELWL